MASNAEKIAHSFIEYLKEQDQYGLLPEVSSFLQDEVFRNQDITVISAAELPKSEQQELEETLTKKWGEHRVVFTVDPVILSGLIVRFQDKIIDMSGRGKLTSLAQELK